MGFPVRIEERLRKQRMKEYSPELFMLIPQEDEKTWGKKRKANKVNMLSQLVGHHYPINMGRDKV